MWGEALFSFQSWLHKGVYFEVRCRNVIASYKLVCRSSLQMNTQLLLPESSFLFGEREGGYFSPYSELGPHGTWWSCWAAGWLLWHPVGQVTGCSQKSLISTQIFTPSIPCDSPFGWYHCSSSQQITTNKPALPKVTGLVTGRRWQSVWGIFGVSVLDSCKFSNQAQLSHIILAAVFPASSSSPAAVPEE